MGCSITVPVRFLADEIRRQVGAAFGDCTFCAINDYARAAIGRLAHDHFPSMREWTDAEALSTFSGRYTAWLAVVAALAELETADHYALGAKDITPSRAVFKEAQRELGRLDEA